MVAMLARGPGRMKGNLKDLPALLRPSLTPLRSVRWAIADLEHTDGSSPTDCPSQPKPVTQQRIDYLFDNSLFDLPDAQRPDCHRLKEHTYNAVYGRLRWDTLAPTITRGFDTMGRGRFVHPSQRRTLTPHEAARLQMIPDFFDLSPAFGGRRELVELIGNAVPPKLSYAVALELLR